MAHTYRNYDIAIYRNYDINITDLEGGSMEKSFQIDDLESGI